MTKCASCRVRHLNCNTHPRHPTCTECEKSGRECDGLNIRFRYLVCPSKKTTRPDYSKYEFFFDGEQTWIGTNGKLEFVAGNDISADTSPTNELQHTVFDAVDLDTETGPAPVEQPSSTSVLGLASHNPTVQVPVLDDDPPDYLAALENVPHGPPGNIVLDDASKMPARLLRETYQPGEKLTVETSSPYLGGVLPPLEVAQPLRRLQEGKLFQHFITNLAPWVCHNVFLVR